MKGFFQEYLFLHRTLTNTLNEVLAEFGLSYSLWKVIFYVEKRGVSQLSSIADHFQIERPSITRVVQRLEQKGIMEEVPGKDKRGKSVQLSEEGKKLHRTCQQKITELEQRVLSGISEEKLQLVSEVFPAVRDNLIAEKEDYDGETNLMD